MAKLTDPNKPFKNTFFYPIHTFFYPIHNPLKTSFKQWLAYYQENLAFNCAHDQLLFLVQR